MPIPVNVAKPEDWSIELKCSAKGRADPTAGAGCGMTYKYLAEDIAYSYLGSGLDNDGRNYYHVTCPSCGKVLLLHDNEVPPHVAKSILDKKSTKNKAPANSEQASIRSRHKELEKEYRAANAVVKEVRAKIEALQETCSHPKMYRYWTQSEYTYTCPDCGYTY